MTAVIAEVIVCMSHSLCRIAEACPTSKRDASQLGARSHASGQLCNGKGVQVGLNIAWASLMHFEHPPSHISTFLEGITHNLVDLRQASLGSPTYLPFEIECCSFRGDKFSSFCWAELIVQDSQLLPQNHFQLKLFGTETTPGTQAIRAGQPRRGT